MRVFVCGPLRFREVMKLVTESTVSRTQAVLPGYASVRVKGRVFHGLIADATTATQGVLYEYLDEAVVSRIEAFKGIMYQRKHLPVNTVDGRKLVAAVYVTKPEYHSCLSKEPWKAEDFFKNRMEEFIKFHEGMPVK